MSRTSYRPTSSLEDYLEAIAVLKEQVGKVTVTALSRSLGVKKPSVYCALKRLSEGGLVVHERYGDVDLTPEGTHVANEVYRRHKALFSFLTDVLGLDPETAGQDACSMEHALSRDSILRLEKFIRLVMECYPGRADWEDIFNRYVDHGKDDRSIETALGGKP